MASSDHTTSPPAPPRVAEIERIAAGVRRRSVRMVARHGFGYLGQALSSAELISTLLSSFWRVKQDRFVLSPGHYVIAVYAAAVELGLLDAADLESYGEDGSRLEAIGTETTPVVDVTCGSLGQGLSAAVGIALSDRLERRRNQTYAFISDGELQEGQVWEAALFAGHHGLDRLVAVVDANNSQVDGPVEDITSLEPMAAKWEAFGWQALEVDGHDVAAVHGALSAAVAGSRPAVVIGRTSTTHGLGALPPGTDGHFIKLPDDLAAQAMAELERTADA